MTDYDVEDAAANTEVSNAADFQVRAVALELAIKLPLNNVDETVKAAEAFYKYIKG